MDPSTMDFLMQHHGANMNNAGSSLENTAYTHCPALRAAADPQSLLNSPTRGTHHYDPVHGNTTYRYRWREPQPVPRRGWHPARTDQPSHRADQSSLDPFQMPPVPSLGQANHTSHSAFSLLAESEAYRLQSPPYHYRPSMQTMPRMGSTAPAQHIHGNHSNPGQAQAGTPNMALHRGHVQRPSSGFPAVNPVSHQALAQSARPAAVPVENTTPPAQQPTDQFAPLDYLRHDNVPSASTSFPRPEASMQARSAGESGNPQPGLSAPQGSGEVASPTESRQHTTPRIRRNLPRLQSSTADWSSDDDQDVADPDSSTLSVPEEVAGGQVSEGLRQQQLLRGAVTGRRVASKKAIASLESVTISELPENERTCVICYNDFGVENPEGINEAPLRLPKCRHVFGDHCIKKWFIESDSCPYCRDKVPSEPQYRSMTTHSVFRFMRQHHIQIQQLQQAQAARQAQSRERERNDATSPPGRPTSTLLNLSPLTSSPFSEFGFGGSGDTSTARRVEGTYMYGSRPPGWHAAPERRSPPNEFNDSRRRTRARHGSLRGSPPSGRTNSFNMSPTSNQGNHQAQTPYQWFNRPVTNHHRSSAAAPFDANGPPPFPLHSAMGSSDAYLNPLNTSSPNTMHDEYPLTLPQMRSQRSQYMPPLSPTIGGPDIYMTNSDDTAPSHPAPHQQF